MLTKAHKLTIRKLAGLEEEPSGTEIYDFFTGEGEIYKYLSEVNALVEMVKTQDRFFQKATSIEIRRFIVNEMYNASIAHSYSQSLRQARRHFLRKVFPLKPDMDDNFFKELRPKLKSSVALPHNLDDFNEQSQAFRAQESEFVKKPDATVEKAQVKKVETSEKNLKRSKASSKN